LHAGLGSLATAFGAFSARFFVDLILNFAHFACLSKALVFIEFFVFWHFWNVKN
jgi:hypothetical protein